MALRFWLDRPTLVTGATGLIGSWLVRRLLEMEANVICLVRDWIPQSELIQSGMVGKTRIIRGDVCDQALLERVLGEYEVDTVFHLAAQTVVGVANRNPISTFETNIKGTWTLLEACRRSPSVKQIVVASSDKAYGEQPGLPYKEDMPLAGRYPYDVSKSCADLIAQSYAKSFGLPIVITRCGNVFGGGDLNWNRIVPGTIRSFLLGMSPVIRSDATFVRDYFYVEDAVAAYTLAAEQLASNTGLAGQAFNFSNEQPLSVLQMVRRIASLMEYSLEPDIRGEACNEIRAQYLSAEKARRILGWQPNYDLNQALRLTIDWYREFFNGRSGNRSPKT